MPKRAFLALAACLLIFGCDGNSPANPEDALVFQGTVTSDGREQHFLTLPNSRIGRLVITELRARLIQVVPGFAPSITLGFSLGRPTPEGECAPTFSASVREGNLFVFGLEAVDYCLAIFDTGALPDDALVDYTMTLSLE